MKDGRSAKEDDILPDGYRLKKGDGVYYTAYAMGRMPYIWGEDAVEFRPERWLNNGIFQPESPFKFVSFHVRLIDLLPVITWVENTVIRRLMNDKKIINKVKIICKELRQNY